MTNGGEAMGGRCFFLSGKHFHDGNLCGPKFLHLLAEFSLAGVVQKGMAGSLCSFGRLPHNIVLGLSGKLQTLASRFVGSSCLRQVSAGSLLHMGAKTLVTRFGDKPWFSGDFIYSTGRRTVVFRK